MSCGNEENVLEPHVLDHPYAFASDCYDYNEVKLAIDNELLDYEANYEPHNLTIKTEVIDIQTEPLLPLPQSDDDGDEYLVRTEEVYIKEEPFAPSYECAICCKLFDSEHNLKLHKRYTHNRTRQFSKCHICNEQVLREDLAKHTLTHRVGKNTDQCDICHKRFASKNCLKIHMYRHTPFECDICHERFIHKARFETHLRTHTGQKAHQCDVCEKSFNLKYSLTEHMRTHTTEKSFECEVCNKRFNLKVSLTMHMTRTHKKEKLHNSCAAHALVNRDALKCDICLRTFSTQHSVKVHRRTHTGEKPFACIVCQRRFNQKVCLTVHMIAHKRDV